MAELKVALMVLYLVETKADYSVVSKAAKKADSMVDMKVHLMAEY